MRRQSENSEFRMVKYAKKAYPQDIELKLAEIAGHFDVKGIKTLGMEYSLHTEYSYKPRKFDTPIIKPFKTIIESELCGVPELWKNEKWAKEFVKFIIKLVDKNEAPSVIEIHPPFDNYANGMLSFF